MGYPIENKLVVAVASSALFDLSESDQIFREKGVEEYRRYQRENENNILGTGVAFPLIRRLLSLNGEDPSDQPVEVVLLSRNDSDTGLRVFKSIEHYKLPISRAAFLRGGNPFLYMNAFNASLFLSANSDDVKKAVNRGLPAGQVFPTEFVDNINEQELRIAFDFDGILADDSAEAVYQKDKLPKFLEVEKQRANEPLPPGPLNSFFTKISNLQKIEEEREKNDPSYNRRLKVAIVTARNAPAHERVITTLRSWGFKLMKHSF